VVYGEWPDTGADFITKTIKIIYATKNGRGEIRRVNVNAAPMSVQDLKKWLGRGDIFACKKNKDFSIHICVYRGRGKRSPEENRELFEETSE
jgi:DNA-directed RNA polymerase alpha subunit